MATRGGADLLGHPTGLLEPGRSFDAFVVDVAAASARPSSPLRVWPDLDDDARIFEKVVRLATARTWPMCGSPAAGWQRTPQR